MEDGTVGSIMVEPDKDAGEKFGLNYLIESDSYKLSDELDSFFEQQKAQAVRLIEVKVLRCLNQAPTKTLSLDQLSNQVALDVSIVLEVVLLLQQRGLAQHTPEEAVRITPEGISSISTLTA